MFQPASLALSATKTYLTISSFWMIKSKYFARRIMRKRRPIDARLAESLSCLLKVKPKPPGCVPWAKTIIQIASNARQETLL